MNEDELNSVLSAMDDIVPTSGFVSSVMESVHRETVEPPPIPFPWVRALPGMIVCMGLLAVALVRFLWLHAGTEAGWNSAVQSPAMWLSSRLPAFERAAMDSGAAWVLIALALSFVTWKLSMMLEMRHG